MTKPVPTQLPICRGYQIESGYLKAGVKKFKVIQKDRLHIKILLVTSAGFREADAELIRSELRQRLGEDVTVTIERMADTPPSGPASPVMKAVMSQQLTGRSLPARN